MKSAMGMAPDTAGAAKLRPGSAQAPQPKRRASAVSPPAHFDFARWLANKLQRSTARPPRSRYGGAEPVKSLHYRKKFFLCTFYTGSSMGKIHHLSQSSCYLFTIGLLLFASVLSAQDTSSINNGTGALLEELRGMRSLLSQLNHGDSTNALKKPALLQQAMDSSEEQQRQKSVQDSIDWVAKEKQMFDEMYSGDSRKDLFAKIFGVERPARPQMLIVEILWNGNPAGTGELHYNQDFSTYTLASADFTSYLQQHLKPGSFEKLKPAEGHIQSTQWGSAGLKVKLSEEQFQLYIEAPQEILQEQRHDLSTETPEIINLVKPALISAYLNTYTSQDWLYQELFFDDDSQKKMYREYYGNESIQRQALNIEFDGALNINSWIAEGRGVYNEMSGLRYDELFLNHDFGNKHSSRLRLGDLSENSIVPLLGIQWDIQPNRDSKSQASSFMPSSDAWMEFILLRPAQAEVRINGRFVRRLRLEAGPNALGGFQGINGQNEVEVVVTYDNGQTESIPFIFHQERSGLLETQKRRFILTGGVLRDHTNSGMQQYSASPDSALLSLYLIQGLPKEWSTTLRVNLTSSRGESRASLTIPMSSNGALQLHTALASDWNMDLSGYKLRIQAERRLLDKVHFISGLEYTSTDYSNRLFNVDSLKTQRSRYTLNLDLWVPVSSGYISSRVETRFNRKEAAASTNQVWSPVDYNFNASCGVTLWKTLSVNLSSSVTVQNLEYNPQFNAFLTYLFSIDKHNFHVGSQLINQRRYQPAQIKNQQTAIESNPELTNDSIYLQPGYFERKWNYNQTLGWSLSNGAGFNNGLDLGAELIGASDHVGANGNATYTHNYFQATGNYNLSDYSRFRQLSRNHFLALRAESALLFADGLWGIGRPARYGFALVKGQNGLRNTALRIAPSQQYGSEIGKSGPLLAGSYPHLGEYQNTILQITPEAPPMGAWDGQESYTVQSEYKRGFALRLGARSTVLLQVALVDETGSPINRIVFTIVEKDRTQQVLLESFTNARGVLQAGDLQAGKTYIIRFPADKFMDDIEIPIPYNASGVYQPDPISVKYKQMGNNRKPVAPTVTVEKNAPLESAQDAAKQVPEKSPSATDTAAVAPQNAAVDTAKTIPKTATAINEDRKLDIDDSTTFVLGALFDETAPIAHSFIAILSLEDLQAPWRKTFTDKKGGFQVICPRPGRYKIIVSKSGDGAGINFTSAVFTIPRDKKGFFYHLGKVVIPEKAAPGDSILLTKDAILKKIDVAPQKASGAALLTQWTYVSGTLVHPDGQRLGFKSLTVVSTNDTLFAPMKTFTNKEGAFQFICYTPGQYRMFLTAAENGPGATFTIAPKAKGVLDLGTVKLVK
jgi:hypothetical protein